MSLTLWIDPITVQVMFCCVVVVVALVLWKGYIK